VHYLVRITLLGAAGGEVTGSCYLVETKSATVMVDCGFFQGPKKLENFNRLPTRGAVTRLDAVVLTHAHLDHTGRLPLLAKADYRGPIYGTRATFDLADLILRDSASLHKSDVARENRKRRTQGKPPLDVLFTQAEVTRLRALYKRIDYHRPTEIARGITVRLVDAGHVFGSASIEMTVDEQGRRRVVVFSGDIGPRGAPLHRDPTPFAHADLVFIESTYGDRNHRSLHDTAVEAREIIRTAVEAKAKILVPTFAIGRTQILLYLLGGAFHRRTLTPFPIYVDSPMGIEATRIYKRHVELFDEEALAMQKTGELRAAMRTVRFTKSPRESQALSKASGPCLIMAGAGMCNGGRILNHLRTSLGQPDTTVLFVGFQSRGSLGRALVDGKKIVRVMGEEITVAASTHTMGGLSGHAGQHDLMNWFASLAGSRPRVILTHGEDNARRTLQRLIAERHGLDAECPDLYDVVEI
jgi:metallo-beta-lactamase family protein